MKGGHAIQGARQTWCVCFLKHSRMENSHTNHPHGLGGGGPGKWWGSGAGTHVTGVRAESPRPHGGMPEVGGPADTWREKQDTNQLQPLQ